MLGSVMAFAAAQGCRAHQERSLSPCLAGTLLWMLASAGIRGTKPGAGTDTLGPMRARELTLPLQESHVQHPGTE